MKILRILPSMNPKCGGVAEAVKQSAIVMKEERITIEAVTFDQKNSDFLNELPLKVFALGQGFSGYGIKFSLLVWLMKNLKNYDLVIIDGLWMFHVISGYICKLKGIPYFIYSHGMLDPYFNKNKLKYLKKLPFWFLIERNVIRFAKSIVFTCKEEMILAKKSFPLFKGTSKVVTLGIETIDADKQYLKKLFEETFPELKDKKLFLYLSRIHEKKGLDLLIKSLTSLDASLLTDVKFIIAGSGDEKYIAKLKQMISDANLEPYFTWVGMLSGNLKWAAFNSSDAFILPSHQENFGIVVAEALSFSLPVLTTNKVNIWQEVQDYNAGIIQNDDTKGINILVKKFLALNEDEKKQLKTNGLQCFEESFSKDAFKQDFLKLLEI